MCSATCCGVRAGFGGKKVTAAVAVAMASLWPSLTYPSIHATAAESAVANQAPLWITVSPNYAHSHMVAALTAEMNCSSRCMHLRVTRDGGGSWRDSRLP